MGGHATPTFGHPSSGGTTVSYPPNIGGPPLSPNRGMQPVQNVSAAVSSINRRPAFMGHGATDRRGMMAIGMGLVVEYGFFIYSDFISRE